MHKRFTDTEKWIKNKWFRKLEPRYKLFWLYILDLCDSVGVWNEDVEFASLIIGCEYNKDDILNVFNGKIKVIENGKKWWIIDFCDFQYGYLDEEKVSNRPHQSYIKLLKKHSLWIDYTKTIYSLKEKEKDKEKDIDKEKEKEESEISQKQKRKQQTKKQPSKFIPPTEQEWIDYCIDRAKKEFSNIKINIHAVRRLASARYASLTDTSWVMLNGKKVSNWKLKAKNDVCHFSESKIKDYTRESDNNVIEF